MITKVLALLSLALVISLSQCTGVCWEVALEPIWMESVAQVRRIIVQILLKFLLHIATLAMFCFLKLPKFLRSELACLFSKSLHSAVCSSEQYENWSYFSSIQTTHMVCTKRDKIYGLLENIVRKQSFVVFCQKKILWGAH